MRGLVILIFFIFSITVTAQQAGDNIPRLLDSTTLVLTDDYNRSTILLDRIEFAINRQGAESHIEELIKVYQYRINLNRYYFHPQLCRQILNELSVLIEKHRAVLADRYDSYHLEVVSEWAGFYFDVNDYEKAFELYTQSLEGYKKLPRSPENCLNLFVVSQYMAGIQQLRGESEAAINQYLTSVDYYKCSNETNYPIVFRNIGKAYFVKGDLTNAKRYFNQAEDSLQSIWSKSTGKIEPAMAALSLYEVLSQFYRQSHFYDSALLAIKKAEKYLSYSEEFRSRYLLCLGQTYESLNKIPLAQRSYEEAIRLLFRNNDKDILLADAYLSLGGLFERNANFERALFYYQLAIASLVLNFDPKRKDNPELVNILSKKSLFLVLQHKYTLLEKLSKHTGDAKFLRQAWQTNQLALALIDSTANEVSLDKDKLILAEQSFHAYEDGIRLGDTLFKLTGADRYFQNCFTMMEKSKGVLLLENLRLVNHFSGVEKKLLDKERDLKSELLFHEQEIFQLANMAIDKNRLLSMREDYAKAKRDYAMLMDSIKKTSPSYYQLRFNHEVITISDIQHKLLQPGEAIIEFFVGDKSLVVAGFSKAARYMKVKEMTPYFSEKVIRFRNLLVESDSLRTGKEFDLISTELYDYLLKDCLSSLGTTGTLTIIPDGILGYLPFEVLQEKQSQPSLLIGKYSIRYAYSASYLQEQSKKPLRQTSYFFGGFLSAGNNDRSEQVKRNGLSKLKYAKKEMVSITELVGSQYKVFEDATKEDFIKHASDYRVLHLAMHAQLNDENPMFSTLMFESDGDSTKHHELFAIELYDLQLNSDLAVVSACETGVGQLHRGEGIMSFSRAFAFAGVPSTVISLWKVPDKATSLLMLNFYTHLKNGYTKDVALQKAKQEFTAAYPQMSHPYYWSGFILMGNNAILPFPVSYAWIWWTAVVLLLMIVAFVILKRSE